MAGFTPPTTIYGNQVYYGDVTFTGAVGVPNSSISSASIDTTVPFTASDSQHQMQAKLATASGANVAAVAELVYVASQAATVVNFLIMAETVPTGSDTIVVDLLLSTAGGAYASVLSAAGELSVSESSTDRVAQVITLSGVPALIAGDSLKIVVTIPVSNTTGQGLLARAIIAENPS